MTYESVRAAIATYILAQRTIAGITVPFEFENIELVDHAPRATFVTVHLIYRSAEQADLANAPQTRRDGEIAFHVHVPVGDGTKPATTLLDQITGFMEFVQVSNVQFQAGRAFEPKPFKGHQITPLYFSFHYRE